MILVRVEKKEMTMGGMLPQLQSQKLHRRRAEIPLVTLTSSGNSVMVCCTMLAFERLVPLRWVLVFGFVFVLGQP